MRLIASTLLLAGLITTIAAPPVTAATTTSAVAPTTRPGPVMKGVRLGHQPVKVQPTTRVVLSFRGRKGELVNLARWSVGGVAEHTPRGDRILRRHQKFVPSFADGYWRLPANDTYFVRWRPDRAAIPNAAIDSEVALQVRKVVRRDVVVDGPAIGFPRSADKTYLARVRLGAERIRLRSTGALDHVARGTDFTVEPIGGHDLFLQPGVNIHSDDPRSWSHGRVAASGTYLVAVAAGSRLRLSTTQSTAVTLDGPSTNTYSSAVREQVFTFEGVAGQVVHRVNADTAVWDDELLAPDGTLVKMLGLVRGWELPATGTYTIAPRTVDDYAESREFAVALRTATPGPAMTVGEPARFVPTEAGRWVVSRITFTTSAPYGWLLEATDGAVGDSTWRAAATSTTYSPCPFEVTANGCGSQIGAAVTAAAPVSGFDLSPGAGSTILMVHDPGGSTAPVDLTIRNSL